MDFTIYSVGTFMERCYSRIAGLHKRGGVRIICPSGAHWEVTDYHRGVCGRSRIDKRPISDVLLGRCLVTWNGKLDGYREVVAAAQQHGMRTAFFEYGWFSGMLQLDGTGVNAESSLMHFPADWFSDYPIASPGAIWGADFKQRPIEFGAKDMLPGDVSLPDGCIFFPMQLDNDTQITMHSPHYKSMRDVLADIVPAIPTGMTLLVKEHPSIRDQGIYGAMRDEFPSIVWCRTTPIDTILASASLAITVNSSVGFQAMCRKLPLVVLGNAVYGKAGLCITREYGKTIAKLIAVALGEAPDHELRERFLCFVKERHLVPYVFSSMYQRIANIADGKMPWFDRDWSGAYDKAEQS